MFNKILIANRGEIACRVIRTASSLGIRTVAVYSDADADALHVRVADEAIHIGGSAPADSYLRMERIIEAAQYTGSEAIHPGYGFLSENAEFSGLCHANGIVFVGPPASAIETMGSKSVAKQVMERAGVPLLPGYHGNEPDPALLKDAAGKIGYPVLLKAVSGGGWKGMRQVDDAAGFDEALESAKREALSSFGDDAMLVEKYLSRPRHVEVQVFCDTHENGVYLFERDCSLQRRHQKVIEEAPAPGLADGLREAMGEAALRAAKAVDYVGAGTVEFLLDESGDFFFMEMNTRLQVEHPVTELVTGQDLVEWQLRVADGEPLPCSQDQLTVSGHAFEARIYAEDPNNNFLPAAGTVSFLQEPSESTHVRIDTGVVQGDQVGVFYDPMIAKLVTWDEDRTRALKRLEGALAAYRIVGITTNTEFLKRLAGHPDFIAADLSTDFIGRNEDSLLQQAQRSTESLAPIAGLYLVLEDQARAIDVQADSTSPWNAADSWRLNAPAIHERIIVVDEEEVLLKIEESGPNDYVISLNGRSTSVKGSLDGAILTAIVDGHRQVAVVVSEGSQRTLLMDGDSLQFSRWRPNFGEEVGIGGGASFTAPMHGTIVEVLVARGDAVEAGETIVIMEAMKMEHAIKAPVAGTVTEIFFGKGELVDGGSELLTFEANEK